MTLASFVIKGIFYFTARSSLSSEIDTFQISHPLDDDDDVQTLINKIDELKCSIYYLEYESFICTRQ